MCEIFTQKNILCIFIFKHQIFKKVFLFTDTWLKENKAKKEFFEIKKEFSKTKKYFSKIKKKGNRLGCLFIFIIQMIVLLV